MSEALGGPSLNELLPVPLPIFLALFASVAFGALIQGALGFGMNVVAAPIAALVHPEALPTALIVMSLPLNAGAALRERAHVDREGVLFTTLGRLPGVAIGAFIVSRLDPSALAPWIGGVVVVASLSSVWAPKLRATAMTKAFVGALAGVMGTTSSVDGPPLALLYQREPGPVLRATLGATFLIGSGLSLAALAAAGRVDGGDLALGLALTPAVVLGLAASRPFHAHVDAGWLRPGLVALTCLAGLGVIARGFV
jgi:uncharacterized membrane protein YfcA